MDDDFYNLPDEPAPSPPANPLADHFKGYEAIDVEIAKFPDRFIDIYNEYIRTGVQIDWHQVAAQAKACQAALKAADKHVDTEAYFAPRIEQIYGHVGIQFKPAGGNRPIVDAFMKWQEIETWARRNTPEARLARAQERARQQMAAEREEAERPIREARQREEREAREREEEAARERRRKAREAEDAREAEYVEALPGWSDPGKLGRQWKKATVRSNPSNPNGVAAVTRREYRAGERRQHLLGPQLARQLSDLADLAEAWHVDERALSWLYESFTYAGGRPSVFWAVVAEHLGEGQEDEPEEDRQPIDGPGAQAIADQIYADEDARAAVREAIRNGRYTNHRELADAAAAMCGQDAESIRVHAVVPMSKNRRIVKVDAAGRPVDQQKKGYYVLAEGE